MLIEDVARYQSRAKTALIFSRREGCCVAVTESLFADTPMGLMADAHIGPLEYINEKTGIRLERKRNLSGQLMDFVERSEQFRPREWALENISNAASTAKLNAFLRKHALKEGRPWTQDLVVPCWRPHPTVSHNPEGESLRPAYDDLHARWPEVFPSDLFDESWR
jgi:hypothetical protein